MLVLAPTPPPPPPPPESECVSTLDGWTQKGEEQHPLAGAKRRLGGGGAIRTTGKKAWHSVYSVPSGMSTLLTSLLVCLLSWVAGGACICKLEGEKGSGVEPIPTNLKLAWVSLLVFLLHDIHNCSILPQWESTMRQLPIALSKKLHGQFQLTSNSN